MSLRATEGSEAISNMFGDRTFKLAILFSTLWHLFWMSVVGIVVTPSVQPTSAYQEVGFLGPILEKTAFDLMAEEVTPRAETLYAKSALLSDRVYLRPRGPRRKILKEFTADIVLDKFAFYENFVKDTKNIPLYAAEDTKPFYMPPPGKRGLASAIEGPAGEREVIFKPPVFTVSRGIYGDAEEYRVKLKFSLSDDGIVYDPRPIVSSGYPEIDLQTIRFLKRWRFSPLSAAEKDMEAAWGIATVLVAAK